MGASSAIGYGKEYGRGHRGPADKRPKVREKLDNPVSQPSSPLGNQAKQSLRLPAGFSQ